MKGTCDTCLQPAHPTLDRWVYRDGHPVCLDYVPRTCVVMGLDGEPLPEPDIRQTQMELNP